MLHIIPTLNKGGAERLTIDICKNLADRKNKGTDDTTLSEWVEVLYETALLSEGSPVKNPGTFAKRLTKIMEMASNK